MTLDDAIRVKEKYKNSYINLMSQEEIIANNLSIEALKAWRDKRLYSSHLAYYLLPGETVE